MNQSEYSWFKLESVFEWEKEIVCIMRLNPATAYSGLVAERKNDIGKLVRRDYNLSVGISTTGPFQPFLNEWQ